MDPSPIATLPLPQRLALSYAPRRSREAVLTLLLLDNRLADILRRANEPLIAQMKLAWWRDRLAQDVADWPEGEPLLERLRRWPGAVADLGPLVDGWERLLADDLTMSAVERYAQGRGQAWEALAQSLGDVDGARMVGAEARQWALADLALHLGKDTERRIARQAALRARGGNRRLPRSMRTLAILQALTNRALDRDTPELLDGPRAAMLALRIGLTGR